jgi:hypothetical protein
MISLLPPEDQSASWSRFSDVIQYGTAYVSQETLIPPSSSCQFSGHISYIHLVRYLMPPAPKPDPIEQRLATIEQQVQALKRSQKHTGLTITRQLEAFIHPQPDRPHPRLAAQLAGECRFRPAHAAPAAQPAAQGRLKVCPGRSWLGWQLWLWSAGLTAPNARHPLHRSRSGRTG